jgi:hypothetical protein
MWANTDFVRVFDNQYGYMHVFSLDKGKLNAMMLPLPVSLETGLVPQADRSASYRMDNPIGASYWRVMRNRSGEMVDKVFNIFLFVPKCRCL